MAGIIRGGFKGGSFKEYTKPEAMQSKPIEKPKEESWNEYIRRNIAKAPALAYQAGRSGLGLGNIAESAAREAGAPQWLQNVQRALLPSSQQANEEAEWLANRYAEGQQGLSIGNVLQRAMSGAGVPESAPAQKVARAITPEKVSGKYYTESRPEDYWAEQALMAAPFLGAGAAASGLGGLLKAGATQAGIYGGSKIGSALGQEIGQYADLPETGGHLGGLAGGVLGAGAPKIAHKLTTRPSAILKPLIEKTEHATMQNARRKVVDYEKEINRLKGEITPLYNKAEALEGVAERKPNINIGNISNALSKVTQEIIEVVGESELKNINSALEPLKTKLNGGELSVTSAKKFEKTLNAKRYDKSASNDLKNALAPIAKSLEDFIVKNSAGESGKAYLEAKKAKSSLEQLKKNKQDFQKQQKLEFTEAKDRLNILDKAVQKSNKPAAALGGIIGALGIKAVGTLGGSALAGVAGGIAKGYQFLKNEINITKHALQTHPELHAQWLKLYQDAPKLPVAQLVASINMLTDQTEQAIAEEPQKPKGGRGIIKGGFKY
jgi:hypothetical protein